MGLSEKNIRNIFIYTVPKFAAFGISIITLPIFTRLLTPQDYGIITMAALLPSILVGIFSCALQGSAQRFYFEYRADAEKINAFYTSLQLYLFTACVLSTIFVIFFKDFLSGIIFGSRAYGHAVLVSYIATFFNTIIQFYLIIYQNREHAKEFAFFSIFQTFVTISVSLSLVWIFKFSYIGMLYGTLSGSSIVCLALLFHFNRKVSFQFNTKILLENIRYGIQIVPKTMMGFVNRFFDKYVLNMLLSLSSVGIFSIGQNICNTVFLFMNTIWAAIQPVVYREIFDNGAEGAQKAGRLFTIYAYIALAPVILLIVFAEEIVMILAPSSYYGAINIMIVILGGIATNVFGTFMTVQFAYTKKVYLSFPIMVSSAIVNILSNIVLISHFGVMGAAGAIIITYIFTNAIGTMVGQRLHKVVYDWKTISLCFTIVFSAVGTMLYLRNNSIHLGVEYLIKALFIGTFVFIGIYAQIITKDNIQKVIKSFIQVKNA
ncbi:MAG: oligosaccharide flippase family protein [bacterium]